MLNKKVEIPENAEIDGLKMSYGTFTNDDPCMIWKTKQGATVIMAKHLWLELAEMIPKVISIFDNEREG